MASDDTVSAKPEPERETQDSAPDPALDAFVGVWETLAHFDESPDACHADGYLTAIAASRRRIETAEWLPLLGGDAFERAFADPAAVATAQQALEAWLERRREELAPMRLLDQPDACFLTPLFDEWTDEQRTEMAQSDPTVPVSDINSLQTGVLWAEGFLQAVDDFSDDWPAPAESDESDEAAAYRSMLQLVESLLADPQSAEFKAFAASQWKGEPPSRDELLTETCFAVQDLRLYWLDHGPKPEQRRVQAAPGRNDPCPCGSGKKFKKCHGQSG